MELDVDGGSSMMTVSHFDIYFFRVELSYCF